MYIFKSLVQKGGYIEGFEVKDYLIVVHNEADKKAIESLKCFSKTLVPFDPTEQDKLTFEKAVKIIDNPLINLFSYEELLSIKFLPPEALSNLRKNVTETIAHYEKKDEPIKKEEPKKPLQTKTPKETK